MAVVQASYTETMRAGFPGMVANAETQNIITRTNAGAAAIAFGMPVLRSGDHGCVLGTQEVFEAAGAAGVPAPAGATITAAPTVGAGAKEGVYTVTAFVGGAGTASKWNVEDPDGINVGVATGATAFTGGGLTFTIADAGTDPAIGEQLIVTVTPSTATADLDVLGVSVRDASLDIGNADTFKQYDSVPVITQGVVWVTAGETLESGDDVFWNPTTSRYTDTATHLPLAGWKFDGAAVNGGLVKIAKR